MPSFHSKQKSFVYKYAIACKSVFTTSLCDYFWRFRWFSHELRLVLCMYVLLCILYIAFICSYASFLPTFAKPAWYVLIGWYLCLNQEQFLFSWNFDIYDVGFCNIFSVHVFQCHLYIFMYVKLCFFLFNFTFDRFIAYVVMATALHLLTFW